MNPILDMLMNAGGGGAVQQIGQRFGLSDDQTSNALNQLVPAVMAGLQRNSSQEGGMDALAGALKDGNHSQYLDNPELLGQLGHDGGWQLNPRAHFWQQRRQPCCRGPCRRADRYWRGRSKRDAARGGYHGDGRL